MSSVAVAVKKIMKVHVDQHGQCVCVCVCVCVLPPFFTVDAILRYTHISQALYGAVSHGRWPTYEASQSGRVHAGHCTSQVFCPNPATYWTDIHQHQCQMVAGHRQYNKDIAPLYVEREVGEGEGEEGEGGGGRAHTVHAHIMISLSGNKVLHFNNITLYA